MTWFADLDVCTYGYRRSAGLVAVGWLQQGHPYTTGGVAVEVRNKLLESLGRWEPGHWMGYHQCSFCANAPMPIAVMHEGRRIDLGASNLFVPGDGQVYLAPSLIAHYIDAHGYKPPDEFCAALLRCPPVGSEEYLALLHERYPEVFADGSGNGADTVADSSPVEDAPQRALSWRLRLGGVIGRILKHPIDKRP